MENASSVTGDMPEQGRTIVSKSEDLPKFPRSSGSNISHLPCSNVQQGKAPPAYSPGISNRQTPPWGQPSRPWKYRGALRGRSHSAPRDAWSRSIYPSDNRAVQLLLPGNTLQSYIPSQGKPWSCELGSRSLCVPQMKGAHARPEVRCRSYSCLHHT